MRPRALGPYRIIAELGAGGMGVVYLAEDTRLSRQVALKVLPADVAADPTRLRRFEREAMAAARLKHPNIVTIYAVEEVGGVHVLAMEWVAGKSLDKVVPATGLSADRVVSIGRQIAAALEVAHAEGVVHRDIKPANVLLGDDGVVKLVDFGLAKMRAPLAAAADDETQVYLTTLTRTGVVLGTAPYMAPEQARGEPIDARTDLFALGAVLYEMAAGRPAFGGATVRDQLQSVIEREPPTLVGLRPDLPADLISLIEHCLAKDPAARPLSAAAVHGALAALDGAVADPTEEKRERVAGKRLRRWLAMGAVALMAAGVSWLGLAWRSRSVEVAPGKPAITDSAQETVAGARVSERPVVAVLPFGGDLPEPVAWLLEGIPEMLITDLAQSSSLEVLGSDRVYSPPGSAARGPAEIAVLRQAAMGAGADYVVIGTVAWAGESFQIDARIASAATGEVLGPARGRGKGLDSMFAAVDQVGRAIREHFAVDRRDDDPGIASVTTASLPALEHYVAAGALDRDMALEEAAEQLEAAVLIDESFAIAFLRLSEVRRALDQPALAEEAAARAFALADRLPPRDRFVIEGQFMSRSRTTYPQAIAAYEEAARRYPDLDHARTWLAQLHAFEERYTHAATLFEQLLLAPDPDPASAHSLANMLAALGRSDDAWRALDRTPDSVTPWWAATSRGFLLSQTGRFDEAVTAFARAEAISPSALVTLLRAGSELLAGQLDASESTVARLTSSEVAADRADAWSHRARLALHRGRARHARRHLGMALGAAAGADNTMHANVLVAQASFLLAVGDPASARLAAAAAAERAPDIWPGWIGLHLAAVATAEMGDGTASASFARRLRAKCADRGSMVEARLLARLEGRLARLEGDPERAVASLSRAAELLSQRGLYWEAYRPPDHVAIWYELARALEAAGDPRTAEIWYQRVTEAGIERLDEPVAFGRSLFRLGALRAASGDTEGAAEAYQRFIDRWGGGDLDAEGVRRARAFLAAR